MKSARLLTECTAGIFALQLLHIMVYIVVNVIFLLAFAMDELSMAVWSCCFHLWDNFKNSIVYFLDDMYLATMVSCVKRVPWSFLIWEGKVRDHVGNKSDGKGAFRDGY